MVSRNDPAREGVAPAVLDKLTELEALCRVHEVEHLSVFGSGADGRFDPARSDLDFVVRLRPMSPSSRTEHFLGLMLDLQQLFGRRVDLVELEPIQNPFVRRSIEEGRVTLYAA